MFNLSGSEIVFLLLIALIVLGPEKLPEAVRKFGKAYAEIKKMSSGFQSELKSALDEPMREMRETADAFKKAVSFEFDDNGGAIFHDTEPDAETAVAKPAAAEGDPVPEAVDAAPVEPEVVETEPAPVENDPARVEEESATAGNEPPLVRPPGPTFHSAAPQPKVVEAAEAVEAVEETTSE
jgi:sec-independent protein translocase protein TatB